MSQLKILVLAYNVFNPLAINWIHGFQSLGYRVTVLVANKPLTDNQQLQKLGFYNSDFPDVPIFGLWEMVSEESRQAVLDSLGGNPNILFCREGVGVLKHVPAAHSYFSTAKVAYDISTHPNCSNILAEWRYIWLYRKTDPIVNGYVFYSQTQRRLFCKNVPSSNNKP
ncbi:hypothetical protein H1P_6550002 [Hyella patelloides LEGE 07179]|uniref:Uncharacterized protein n=1 Tax=Hyella patelloides LEGE 07179 TaxID=945734 RepID=A0A563W2J8_9CYAN|nr:hypothetical protein [Hyella patelloides]VEP17896.1 hypothetical protein H1P_6550002 [Hyella patelloides LEGE 07179]